jgi:asparagine synthase (glutamine-hydrolysing)
MFGLRGRLADAAILGRMTDAIVHRGPDDEGFFTRANVGFGFRRLAILDLSANGHQPMTTADGRFTIVYNGEIYNYVELRKELAGRGYVFRSTGDTEVLLHAFQEWGTECARRLNGMWAFLIHDAETGALFGCRDRFGIKPLFVWRSDSMYLFSSEVKGIRASGLYRDATNWKVAAEFLVNSSIDRTRESFYEGIESLAPGTWFELTADGRYAEHRYWFPPEPAALPDSEVFTRFAELFEDAVRIHSRSDVPVAVHLSGGLDSTSIICALARQRDEINPGQEIRAFSYMTREFDESPYIADTVRQTRANLARLSATPALLWEALSEMLSYQDEPVHTTMALVSYALMRETARHGIKVVLNGQGADESLAGYPTYFGIVFHQLLDSEGLGAAAREMRLYSDAVGGSFWSLAGRQLQFFVRAKLAALGAYRKISVAKRNAGFADGSWYTSELLQPLRDSPFVSFDLSLRDTLLRSMFEAPLPLYLRIEDRNAMAWSVESRVPFLDYRLVELALAADCRQLMRGPYNKRLLREGMAGRIPESVRLRIDKMGFPTPARQWLSGELFESICDLVNSRALAESGVLNTQQISRDIDRFRRGEADFSMQLFRLAQFGIWLEKRAPTPRFDAARQPVTSGRLCYDQ